MRLHRSYQDPFGLLSKFILLAEGDGGDGGGGGSGRADGGEGGEGDDKDGKGGKKPPVDIEAIVEGRLRKDRESIAKKLGVPLEEAEEIIKKAREADEATKSEAQKDREAAAKEKAEADEAKAAAAKERHEAMVERHLQRALKDLDLDDDAEAKRTQRLLRLIEVEVGASAEDVGKAIDTLKAEWPELFGETAEPKGGGKGGKDSDPKGSSRKGNQGEKTAYERGVERARQRSGGDRQYAFEKNPI